MIQDFNNLVNGSSSSLPAHGRAGAKAAPFLAALFAKQKTKFGGGETPVVVPLWRDTTGQEARAGPEGETSFPYGVNKILAFCLPRSKPKALLWGPPERKLSKVTVRIFAEKSSDFVQDRQPVYKVCVSRLARGFAPRFGRRIFKQFPNEPILFRPKGDRKAAIFCPKAITNLTK